MKKKHGARLAIAHVAEWNCGNRTNEVAREKTEWLKMKNVRKAMNMVAVVELHDKYWRLFELNENECAPLLIGSFNLWNWESRAMAV